MQNEEENSSITNLNGFIKQNRNADFRSIVLRTDRSELIKKGGNTLIHTAVERSNIEIIGFLVLSGFNINAPNSSGQTPLHLALLNSNFQAAQLLLSFDPDILLGDNEGISSLHLCFKKESKVPEYIIGCFIERLKRTSTDAQHKAVYLEKVGCSMCQALAINDGEVMGIILDRRTSIDKDESHELLKRAMDFNYPNSVRALVTRGPESNERLNSFLNKVIEQRHEPEMKFYFEQVVYWDIVTTEFMREAAKTFRKESEDEMKMYLDIGIDNYARRKFGWELLVGLFANAKVDPVKIIKNRQFNINGVDIAGFSSLHIATLYSNIKNIVYLLTNGANPNTRDMLGKTPIFYCTRDYVIEWFLEAGADVQIVDKEGHTVIAGNCRDPIIAKICILEERGLLNRVLKRAVKKLTRLLYYMQKFNAYRQDLERMKTRDVAERMSLYEVLVGKVESTARHVKSKEDIALILGKISERKLQPTYVTMLRKNLTKVMKFHELRPKTAKFFSKVMKIDRHDHLVIEMIVGFLSYRDLLILDKIDVK